MIKAVVFDFGNVIADFNQVELIKQFNPKSMKPLAFQNIIFQNWSALDDGKIELETYIEDCLKRAPESAKPEIIDFIHRWPQFLKYNEPIYELIKELESKEVRLFLLSNAPKFFQESLPNFHILNAFEGLVLSGVEQVSKPNPRIYQILLERYDLQPESTLFIDDLKENVEAARALGIQAVQYKGSTDEIYEWLQKSGE